MFRARGSFQQGGKKQRPAAATETNRRKVVEQFC